MKTTGEESSKVVLDVVYIFLLKLTLVLAFRKGAESFYHYNVFLCKSLLGSLNIKRTTKDRK